MVTGIPTAAKAWAATFTARPPWKGWFTKEGRGNSGTSFPKKIWLHSTQKSNIISAVLLFLTIWQKDLFIKKMVPFSYILNSIKVLMFGYELKDVG